MELLLLLIKGRGQLVARDQIIEGIWGKNVFLDTDNSINSGHPQDSPCAEGRS